MTISYDCRSTASIAGSPGRRQDMVPHSHPVTAAGQGHTPGPWVFISTDPAEGGDWFWIRAQPNAAMRGFTKEIGAINGSQSDPEQAANARLIAAAPELLDAAEAALNFIANTESEFGEKLDSGDKLRAAIAKARGQ